MRKTSTFQHIHPDNRWNHSSSIPIETISKEELPEAIHSWAEGCKPLEKLLWNCYNFGVVTTGSHYSTKGRDFGFIDVNLFESSREQLAKLVFEELKYKKCYIVENTVGNPFGTPNWDDPIIMFDASSSMFQKMADALETDEPADQEAIKLTNNMVEMSQLFTSKVCDLDFWIRRKKNDRFRLAIRIFYSRFSWEQLKNFFNKVGWTVEIEGNDVLTGYVDVKTVQELNNAFKYVLSSLKECWPLTVPKHNERGLGFNYMALLKKKFFGESEKGKRLFQMWLEVNDFRKQ